MSQGILEKHQLQLDSFTLLIKLALQRLNALPDVRQTALDGLVERGVGVNDLASLIVKRRLPQEVHKVQWLLHLCSMYTLGLMFYHPAYPMPGQ